MSGSAADIRALKRAWIAVLGVLVILAIATPWIAARAGNIPAPLDISSAGGQIQLLDQLSLLKETDAGLQPDAVLASPDWRTVSHGDLSQGFTRSVVWLKVELYNSGHDTVTRWLSVGPPQLEDVRLYTQGPDTPELRERYQSGTSRPISERPVARTLSVFPITLAPGARCLALVRVQSRTAMQLSVRMWSPQAYWKSERDATMLHMLLAGIMLTIALFSAVLAVIWRDRVFILLAASIVAEVIYSLAYEGFIYQLLLPAGGDLAVRVTSIFGNLTVALFGATVLSFVGFEKLRAWKWIYRVLIAAMLAGAVWTALGDYRVSAGVTVNGVFLFNLVWIISMLHGWRRKLPNARLMLIAFAPDGATLCLRLAIMTGMLSDRWATGTSQLWDSISILLLMLFIIGGRSRQVYRAQRQAQQDLLDSRAREQERLENAVQTRTGELQQALIAADEANRAKGDFLARVSHDLRTPLTSIIGFADIIRGSGHEHTDRGRIIRRNADHMLSLVNDLIDYAGGDSASAIHTEAIYVHALLEAVGQNGTALAARSGNRFHAEIVGELPPVLEMDGKRVQQILGNLLDNAAKFTTDGDIRLTVECRPLQAAGDGHTLSLAVSDNGWGISAEDQNRVFEPFARVETSRHHPGVGLGLAIVRQWTTRMQGVIHIDSALGKGTTLRIDIPVRVADEADVGIARMPETVDALPAVDGRGRRILVVEDTEEIRRLLSDDLASLGFDVETAANGALAVDRLARRDAPVLNLVLTDHLMPEANGDAVLAAARRFHAGVPVVALSATPRKTGDAATAPGNAGGYDASLLKPVSLVDLRNTVARLLGLAQGAAQADDDAALRPSEDALKEARQLVNLGAISDLIDWADRLADMEPACAPFAILAGRFARSGELARLKTLLAP